MTLNKRQRKHNRVEAIIWIGGMLAALAGAFFLFVDQARPGSIHHMNIPAFEGYPSFELECWNFVECQDI